MRYLYQSTHWKPLNRVKKPDIPILLRPWLSAQGSLTQQLSTLSHGTFKVRVIREYFTQAPLGEAQLLRLTRQQRVFIREVELLGTNGHVWVRARSVLPVHTLYSVGRQFRGLKRRPLGSVLFRRYQPKTLRQVACMNLCARDVNPLSQSTDSLLPVLLWGRRSVYLWHHQPILVQELFMPAFLRFIENKPLKQQALIRLNPIRANTALSKTTLKPRINEDLTRHDLLYKPLDNKR